MDFFQQQSMFNMKNSLNVTYQSYNNIKKYNERFTKENGILFYEAIVTKVDTITKKVDVYISSINSELKGLSLSQSFISKNSGSFSLASKGSSVLVMMHPQIKPCVVSSLTDIYAESPELQEGEHLTFTKDTFLKHDCCGNIIKENLNCIDSANNNGSHIKYSPSSKTFNNQEYSLSSKTQTGNSMSINKIDLSTISISSDIITRLQEKTNKLINLRTALNELNYNVQECLSSPDVVLQSVYDVRHLLYNNYRKVTNSYMVTQKGFVSTNEKEIDSINKINNLGKADAKTSSKGFELIYETKIINNGVPVASIGVDSKGNIDLNCNNLTITERKG